MTTKRSTNFIATAAIAGIILGFAHPAHAQTPEQFYKGKQIELAIGYPPAGSNDVYARLLARHIGKHIPGNPTVVPQNRPGAGSLPHSRLCLQRRAEGRHGDRHRRADRPARREGRQRRACASRARSSTGSAASTR